MVGHGRRSQILRKRISRGQLMVAFFVMGLGGLALVASIDRMRYSADADDLFLIGFGLVLSVFGLLWLRFSSNWRVRFQKERFQIRGFIRVRTWRYQDVKSVSAVTKTIHPKSLINGRVVKFAPKVIETICIKNNADRDYCFTAPGVLPKSCSM